MILELELRALKRKKKSVSLCFKDKIGVQITKSVYNIRPKGKWGTFEMRKH